MKTRLLLIGTVLTMAASVAVAQEEKVNSRDIRRNADFAGLVVPALPATAIAAADTPVHPKTTGRSHNPNMRRVRDGLIDWFKGFFTSVG